MDDRSSLRLGAGAALGGAVLGLVGNLLHPRFGDLADAELYRKISRSDLWVTADFVILAALLLSTAGLVTLGRALKRDGDDGLARHAVTAAVVGGAIALAQTGLDAFAFRQAARTFAGAPDFDRVGAFWATNAIDKINVALFATWTLVFLGLVPLLLVAAATRSAWYPRVAAVIGGVGGLGCAVVGAVGLVRDDTSSLEIPFLVASLLVTAWIFWSGLVLWQRSAGEDSAVRTTPLAGRPAPA